MSLPRIKDGGRSSTHSASRRSDDRSGVVALPDINARSRGRPVTPNYRRVRKFLVKQNYMLEAAPETALPPPPVPQEKTEARVKEEPQNEPQEDSPDDDEFRTNLAAQRIQTVHRGAAVRKEMGKKHAAACTVQRVHRGGQGRTRQKELMEKRFGEVSDDCVQFLPEGRRSSSAAPPGEESWPESGDLDDDVSAGRRRSYEVLSESRGSFDGGVFPPPAVVLENTHAEDAAIESERKEEEHGASQTAAKDTEVVAVTSEEAAFDDQASVSSSVDVATEELAFVGRYLVVAPDGCTETRAPPEDTPTPVEASVPVAEYFSVESSGSVLTDKDSSAFQDRYTAAPGDASIQSSGSVLIDKDATAFQDRYTAAPDDASVISGGSVLIDKDATAFQDRYSAAPDDASVISGGSVVIDKEATAFQDRHSAASIESNGSVVIDKDATAFQDTAAPDDASVLSGDSIVIDKDATAFQDRYTAAVELTEGGVDVDDGASAVTEHDMGDDAMEKGEWIMGGSDSIAEPSDMGSLDGSQVTIDDESVDFAERYSLGQPRWQSEAETAEAPLAPLSPLNEEGLECLPASSSPSKSLAATRAPVLEPLPDDHHHPELFENCKQSSPDEIPLVLEESDSVLLVEAPPVDKPAVMVEEVPVEPEVEVEASIEAPPVNEPVVEVEEVLVVEKTEEVLNCEPLVADEPDAPVVPVEPEAPVPELTPPETTQPNVSSMADDVPSVPEPDAEEESPVEPEVPVVVSEPVVSEPEELEAVVVAVEPEAPVVATDDEVEVEVEAPVEPFTLMTPVKASPSPPPTASSPKSPTEKAMEAAFESKDDTALVLATELRAATTETDVLKQLTSDQKTTIDALIGAKSLQDSLSRAEAEAAALKYTAAAQAQTIEVLMAEIRSLKSAQSPVR